MELEPGLPRVKSIPLGGGMQWELGLELELEMELELELERFTSTWVPKMEITDSSLLLNNLERNGLLLFGRGEWWSFRFKSMFLNGKDWVGG